MPEHRRKTAPPRRWTPRIVPRNGALDLDAPAFVRVGAMPASPRGVLAHASASLRQWLKQRKATLR